MILHEADPAALERLVGLGLDARPHSWIDGGDTLQDRLVQAWLRSTDRAFLSAAGCNAPPVWLAHRFAWGPHAWPISWRDIPRMPVLDCGAIAALSTELFRWRDWDAAPVQLLLQFTPESVRGWQALWREAGADGSWAARSFAYHEATLAVMPSGDGRIWDPLGRFWLPVAPQPGYEGLVALRVCGADAFERIVPLAGQRLRSGVWYVVADSFRSAVRRAPTATSITTIGATAGSSFPTGFSAAEP